MLRTLACTVAAAALFIGAPVALAHPGNPEGPLRRRAVTRPCKALNISILTFNDRLLVHNASGQDVTILDYQEQETRYAQSSPMARCR